MNQFNYFNLLPPEIIEIIFKKLNLDNLINLKIVDKRFKEICEQIKIKQLTVCEVSKFDYSKFWFYTNDPNYLNKENLIRTSKLPNYKSIFKLDQYLKRLTICIDHIFNISILNEFKLLEQLDLRSNYYQDYDVYTLDLENLKIAEINLYLHDRLILNTNKLFAFKSDFSLNDFNFIYPDKILFYELNCIDYIDYNDGISIFNNLEYLHIKLTNTDIPIDRDILTKLSKNLKMLDINIDNFVDKFQFSYLKEDINFIIDEKRRLKMYALQIYFQGVKLINQNKINQFELYNNKDELEYNRLEFQIKNYDLLKDNCYKDEINYCDLIKLIDKIPSTFLNKFPTINKVYANDHINNEDQFIKFLINLPYLSKLKLENCNLSQLFYDNLINFVYLEELILNAKIDLKLNFDFILDLKELKKFETNQIINNHMHLINKLFIDNLNIEKIYFQFKANNYIQIFRNLFDNFCIDFYYDGDGDLEKIANFPFESLDNIFLRLKEMI